MSERTSRNHESKHGRIAASGWRRLSGVCAAACCVVPLAAWQTSWADELPPAEKPLGSIGRTQLQRDTGDAVQITCGGFIAAGTQPGTVPLFDTCSAMVQTANDLLNNGGGTGSSLGLTRDELADSLQQVATEEYAATQSMAAELASNSINSALSRLVAVRRGVSGFSVSGLMPDTRRGLATNAFYTPSQSLRGGAAGDGPDWGRFSAFASVDVGSGDRDATERTDSFDFDTLSLTAGADYRFGDNLIAGALLTYSDVSSSFNDSATVSGGGVDSDGWSASVYGTWYKGPIYVDGLIGYGTQDYDIRRRIFIPSRNPAIATINETASGSTDSNDLTLSLGAGYQWNTGPWNLEPYARLTYLDVDVDGYRESGAEASGLNLNVDGQDWKSFTSVVGARVSRSLSHSFGVVVPQARVAWVHEFENNSEEITATYIADPRQNVLRATSDEPDRDYFKLGLGLSVVLPGGAQLFVNYDTVLGLDGYSQYVVSLGGRIEL